jgi:hypothetical protein
MFRFYHPAHRTVQLVCFRLTQSRVVGPFESRFPTVGGRPESFGLTLPELPRATLETIPRRNHASQVDYHRSDAMDISLT